MELDIIFVINRMIVGEAVEPPVSTLLFQNLLLFNVRDLSLEGRQRPRLRVRATFCNIFRDRRPLRGTNGVVSQNSADELVA